MNADTTLGRSILRSLQDGTPEDRSPPPTAFWKLNGYVPTRHAAATTEEDREDDRSDQEHRAGA